MKTPSISAETPVDVAIEQSTRSLGKRILDFADQTEGPSLLSTRGLYGKLMEWSLRDPAFKTQLFRFVDVFPSLRSREEIERHFREYLDPGMNRAPSLLRAGLKASAFSSHLLQTGVRANINGMARLFIVDNRPGVLAKTLCQLHEQGISFTVDLLGETVISEREADAYARQCIQLLELLSTEIGQWKKPDLTEIEPGNGIPKTNLSIKISALYSQINPADPEHSLYHLKRRLRPILRKANQLGAFINFDMERYALKEITLALFRSLLEEKEFAQQPNIGLAIQAHLRDSEEDLANLLHWARWRNQPLTVRLVKGAYWDYETVIARQRNWPVPVFLHKHETDLSFERLSRLLLENTDLVTPAFGSHNVRSLAHAITYAAALGVDKKRFEIQVLHGMAQSLTRALVHLGLQACGFSRGFE